jgi:hypothetical protein
MAMVYGVGPDDVFCTTADPGCGASDRRAVHLAQRAARQEDCEGSLARAYDLSPLRRIFVGGERY